MMDLPLRSLRYFLAAAEHGSVTAAARALNVSQPSVSLAVLHLEQLLGVQLFIRQHSRGVALTPSGLELLRETRKFLAQAEDFMGGIVSIGGAMQGTLSFGCFSNLVPRFLGSMVSAFTARYPGIQLAIYEGDHDQLLDWMQHGVIEVAITYDLFLSEQFTVKALADLPPYVLVPARHRLARQQAIFLKEVVDEPFVLLDRPLSQEYLMSVFTTLGLRPDVRYRTRSIEALRTFVGNGLGYALSNQAAATDVTYDGTKVRALALKDKNLPRAHVASVHLKSLKLRQIGEVFLDFCREYFSELKVSAKRS